VYRPSVQFIIVDGLSRDSAIPELIPSSQILAPNVGPIAVESRVNFREKPITVVSREENYKEAGLSWESGL